MTLWRPDWQRRPVEHLPPPADELEHDLSADHAPYTCPTPELYEFAAQVWKFCSHDCICGPTWTAGGTPHHWIAQHHDVITVPYGGREAGPGSYG